MSISAREAHGTLFSLIERVNEDCEAVEIDFSKGNAIRMSVDCSMPTAAPVAGRPRSTISIVPTGEPERIRSGIRRRGKRINTLVDACLREPFSGSGKPEHLRCRAQG